MRSGDQVLVEAIIRSLPARRLRDERLAALERGLAPAMQRFAEACRQAGVEIGRIFSALAAANAGREGADA